LAGEEKTGACGNVDAGELVDHCSHRVRDSSAYVASAYSVDVVEPVDDEEDLPLGVFGAAVEQSFGECFGGSCESWAAGSSSWLRRLLMPTSTRTRWLRSVSVSPSQQWWRATIQSRARDCCTSR
jgi:hypothetical protein